MADRAGLGADVPGPRGIDPTDPTRNVLDLVEAAIRRQDDLREAEARHIREVLALRSEIAQIRDDHAKEIRGAEAGRLDAIREVDVGSGGRAAEDADRRAATLAAQVATSAETLRAQVVAADAARRSELAAALGPIQTDIADLRRAQYEAQGVKAQTTESGVSSRVWIGLAIAAAALLSSFFLGAAGIVITLLLSKP